VRRTTQQKDYKRNKKYRKKTRKMDKNKKNIETWKQNT
jgi:hypothetical protein